jgi:hypothetical protein
LLTPTERVARQAGEPAADATVDVEQAFSSHRYVS